MQYQEAVLRHNALLLGRGAQRVLAAEAKAEARPGRVRRVGEGGLVVPLRAAAATAGPAAPQRDGAQATRGWGRGLRAEVSSLGARLARYSGLQGAPSISELRRTRLPPRFQPPAPSPSAATSFPAANGKQEPAPGRQARPA